jgi:hypothetical protein
VQQMPGGNAYLDGLLGLPHSMLCSATSPSSKSDNRAWASDGGGKAAGCFHS